MKWNTVMQYIESQCYMKTFLNLLFYFGFYSYLILNILLLETLSSLTLLGKILYFSFQNIIFFFSWERKNAVMHFQSLESLRLILCVYSFSVFHHHVNIISKIEIGYHLYFNISVWSLNFPNRGNIHHFFSGNYFLPFPFVIIFKVFQLQRIS